MIKRKLLDKIRPFFDAKEAIVITGMRRTGKTSLLTLIYEQIPSSNKIFLDLENPLHQSYFTQNNFDQIKSNLEFLGLRFDGQSYLFLDEIQLVPNLPQMIKYLIDHTQIKCFLTGSASFYVKHLFTESLVGRKYIFELFPLDFEEFLLFKQKKLTLPKDPKEISQEMFSNLSPLYDEYLYFGGFPDVVLKENIPEKKKALEDIFSSYFQLEVIRIGGYRKNTVIRDLMLLLMERIGSKIDVSKLASEIGISRITLNEYLSFLEGTYFISLVRPFSRNRDTEIRKMPKVYLCDSGLAYHHARITEGSLLENNVYQNLKTLGEVNYYQKKSGVEIDFIFDKRMALEIKTKANLTDIRKLEKYASEIKLRESRIISRTYLPDLIPSGKIIFPFCMPA